jgi:hypothetical protein
MWPIQNLPDAKQPPPLHPHLNLNNFLLIKTTSTKFAGHLNSHYYYFFILFSRPSPLRTGCCLLPSFLPLSFLSSSDRDREGSRGGVAAAAEAGSRGPRDSRPGGGVGLAAPLSPFLRLAASEIGCYFFSLAVFGRLFCWV